MILKHKKNVKVVKSELSSISQNLVQLMVDELLNNFEKFKAHINSQSFERCLYRVIRPVKFGIRYL